ncbi:LysR family transcriptional regulator [Streptomyces sp. Ru87]|uniref:LysR family transcriptional regulator n=1 Tax=Streptomyces sp. Ru87 TaxID=2044307 RepID=UPI000BF3A886|nr:LysR family transcriptional regulator [Streptomyces sp. Ru87]PGH48642.1 LysR family transcriptional regulator [Streptomyces sp. Ru87]
MIEARHLRVLRAVAACGSFSAAARELGCTQPAVSQQMRALEQSAGTPLLLRSGRDTRLTQAGEALLRHAAGVLAGLAAAEEEVAAIAGLRAGRVRLVSFPSGSSALVPGALAALRAGHPGIEVSLVEAEPPRSVDMLRSGDCDIALAFRYPQAAAPSGDRAGRGGGASSPSAAAAAAGRGAGEGPGPGAGAGGGTRDAGWEGLVARPLLTDRLVAVLPDGHRCAGAGRVGLAELAEETWIAGCPRCRSHLVEVCEGTGFTPRIDFATDDYPAVVGLVGAGLGVAVLPELALASVRPRGVVTLPVEPAVRREVVALTLPDLERVPAVAAMLDRLESAAAREASAGAESAAGREAAG